MPRGEFSLVIAGLAGSVAILPEATRSAIVGGTSLYVIAMVLIGSLVFGNYDRLNDALTRRLRSRAAREREAARQRELDSVTLD